MDFEDALSYIAKDEKWGNKLLIGAIILLLSFGIFLVPFLLFALTNSGFALLSSFVVCLIVSFILCFSLAGYFMVTTNNLIKHEERPLAEWKDFWCLVIVGVKYFVGYTIYCLPIILSSLIVSLLLGLAVFNAQAENFLSSGILFLFITLAAAFVLLLYILTMLFAPLMMANFAKDMKILSFVKIKEAFEMVKDNIGNYLILLLLFIAIGILAQIICSLLSVTIIGLILVPVVYFYTYLIAAHLIAQFVQSKDSCDIIIE